MSSPLLWYVSCWCWAWKIPHSKNLQVAWSYWWACENSKAVCFPKQRLFSPLKRHETEKNISQFLFYFLTSIAYYSQIAKKDIYLNSGLTSTKNYGKTILTKVGEFPPLQSVNFLCTCVCVVVLCAPGLFIQIAPVCLWIVTSSCVRLETNCWFPNWVTSLGQGCGSQNHCFCSCWQGELPLNGTQGWIHCTTGMRKHS